MLKRSIGLGLFGILLATAVAAAQTAPSPGTTPSTTQPKASAPSTTTSTGGAFDKLSPGNKKIAQALCNGQTNGCTSSSLNQIADMKQHKGWGEIFKEMKKSGQFPPDVKNLGQLVSGKAHPKSGAAGDTTSTTASGKSQEAGSKSGKGHLEDDSSGPGSSGRPSGHGGGRGK